MQYDKCYEHRMSLGLQEDLRLKNLLTNFSKKFCKQDRYAKHTEKQNTSCFPSPLNFCIWITTVLAFVDMAITGPSHLLSLRKPHFTSPPSHYFVTPFTTLKQSAQDNPKFILFVYVLFLVYISPFNRAQTLCRQGPYLASYLLYFQCLE